MSLIAQFETELNKLKAEFCEVLDELSELDPEGWEVWFDDEANVPDFTSWLYCEPALNAIKRRVAELHEQIIAPSVESV